MLVDCATASFAASSRKRSGASFRPARRIFLLPHCVIEHSVRHHNGVRGVMSIEHRLDGERLFAELCAGRAPGTVPDEFPPGIDPLRYLSGHLIIDPLSAVPPPPSLAARR